MSDPDLLFPFCFPPLIHDLEANPPDWYAIFYGPFDRTDKAEKYQKTRPLSIQSSSRIPFYAFATA
jgi:hypothetical protein